MAVGLDGRNFTKPKKVTCKFEAPFDIQFRDAMIDMARHLMDYCFYFPEKLISQIPLKNPE